MMDQMMMNLYRPMINATDRDVMIRVMRPKGWKLSEDIADRIGEDLLRATVKRIQDGKIIQREPEKVPVFLVFSEKEVAALSFAKLDGELDYLAFKSKDCRVHKWCEDLFNSLWKNSQPGEVRVNIA